MKIIRAHIAQRQAAFADHPFFTAIESNPPIDQVMGAMARLTFWVMTFQDILRLAEREVTTPALRKIARHHRKEDAGHETWFLADLARFRTQPPTIVELFGRDHAPARDAAYQLMSEVFRVTCDELRVALLLVLESAGHVFFDRVAQFVERAGYTDRLRYFSHHHLEVERAHAVFEQEAESRLDAIVLEPALRDEGLALVDRCYQAFDALLENLAASLLRDTRESVAV
jgi:hypothetical protein